MKKFNLPKIAMISAITGVILSLSFCKKDTETVYVHDTVTVHDTLRGKAILGVVTYPDFTGVVTPAKGAVVNLYVGTSTTTFVASTFADISGNYKFPYLLPGTYFITSKYNTANTNARLIDGINFATNPGYTVTLATTDLTQDVSLVSFASNGTIKVATDTISAGATFRKFVLETHSKIDFGFLDHGNLATLAGGFNTFAMTNFVFDEASPANTLINGYVLLSSVNTFEPTRDDLAAGCVRKTLNVDTIDASTPLPESDTARFYSVSVEKYGDGYLCHGRLAAFYKHPTGGIYPADTVGGFAGPFNQVVDKPCDLYFTYEGKTKVYSGANWNYFFVFEAEFTFNPLQDYYISSAHIGNGAIKVNCHVQFKGTTNAEY